MEKIVVTEEQVKKVLDGLLTEEMKKVSRQEFNRVQFKIEELQNSLNETVKDFTKLQNSLPSGLQTVSKSRLISIGTYLMHAQSEIEKLKQGMGNYKKKLYSRQLPPKDKLTT